MMPMISFDRDWQFPAITEQHAFLKMHELCNTAQAVVYLAFPWATLIDLLDRGRLEEAQPLLNFLPQAKEAAKGRKKCITVCQHINLVKHLPLLVLAGITDVFWSHATLATPPEITAAGLVVHPFPLYPVQAVADGGVNVQNALTAVSRDLLFSFVGARSNAGYLTDARNLILNNLCNDARGLVIAREAWHYEKVVYEHQIHKQVDLNEPLVDNTASIQFQDILRRSVFALCPSGSGPNSIRLWEAIGFGAIPVILADTFLPPGDLALWQEAAVFCAETAEAINGLPDRLALIAKDDKALQRKRQALKQLWLRYGPDCFVYDVMRFVLANEALSANNLPVVLPAKLKHRVGDLLAAQANDALLCKTITSYLLLNARQVKAELLQSQDLMSLVTILASQPLEPASVLLHKVGIRQGVLV